MGGGGGGWNPVAAITDPISSALGTDGGGGGVLGGLASIDPGPAIGQAAASIDPGPAIGGALASIDPGPAISKLGVEIDKGVNNYVPGGWTMVAAVAAMVAMPYLTAYLAAEGATLSAAEFAAYDMANLAAQGISESQMVQIGVASGMDVMAATDMASMAAQGLSASQMATTMEMSYSAGEIFTSEAIPIAEAGQAAAAEMPVDELKALEPVPENAPVAPETPTPNGIDAPVNPSAQNGITPEITAGTETSAPVYDYSAPADAATEQMAAARDAMPWYEKAAETMTAMTPSWDTVGQLAVGSMLAPTVLDAFGLGPKTPGAPTPAPLPNIPATKWGSTGKLVDPGLNPGWINPTDVYTQTNPTDAKFYWGAHPYMARPEDLPHYNAIANLPVTPWGHHDETKPLDVNQFTQNLLGGPYAGNPNMPTAPIAPRA